MPKQHTYILGINTYDHDVSACLLRDGEIAYAIAKERITREKHASGFHQGGRRLLPEGRRHHARRRRSGRAQLLRPPGRGDGAASRRIRTCRASCRRHEREQAAKHPLFRRAPTRCVTISHHLAHAYSAFAACPFEEGVVMVVDGVGSYSADVIEDYPAADRDRSARARVGELLPVQRLQARDAEEGLAGAEPRLPERRVLQHAGPRRDLQPGLDLRLRRLEQVRRADGPCALRPPRIAEAADARSRTAS